MTPNVVNIDGSDHIQKQAPTRKLTGAVESISSYEVGKILTESEKKEYAEAEVYIQRFLKRTRIQANLLSGDYQAWLKLVAPIFFDAQGTLKELPFLNILIALLARLKKKAPQKYPMQYSDEKMQKLDTIVGHFIQKSGESPSDATTLPKVWKRTTFKAAA